jgi:hypothetical protein
MAYTMTLTHFHKLVLIFIVFAHCPAYSSQDCKVLDVEISGKYEGACVVGLAQGAGKAEGSIATYEGGFLDGHKHGHGIKKWTNGDYYQGEFAMDFKHGKGIYTWSKSGAFSGERYEGEYVNDKRHGQGRYDWSNGEHYIGEWKEDKLAGKLPPRVQLSIERDHAIWNAVRKPGIRVCQKYQFGLVGNGRLSGIVKDITINSIIVELDEVGEFALPISGIALKPGIILSDNPLKWRPCY